MATIEAKLAARGLGHAPSSRATSRSIRTAASHDRLGSSIGMFIPLNAPVNCEAEVEIGA